MYHLGMAEIKFRRAKDVDKTEERVPLACRVRKSLKKKLLLEAKAGGLSLGELVEAILDDYGLFLDKDSSKRK